MSVWFAVTGEAGQIAQQEAIGQQAIGVTMQLKKHNRSPAGEAHDAHNIIRTQYALLTHNDKSGIWGQQDR